MNINRSVMNKRNRNKNHSSSIERDNSSMYTISDSDSMEFMTNTLTLDGDAYFLQD